MKAKKNSKNKKKRSYLLPPEKCFWADVGEKGRGVVSNTYIKKGEEIAMFPLIQLSPGDQKMIESSIIQYYVFASEEKMSPYSYLALGVGSLFNHDDRPNAEYFIDEKYKVMTVVALEDIGIEKEITIFYGWD